MKRYLFLLCLFISGIALAVVFQSIRNELALRAFHDSNDYLVPFNPYRYSEISKEASTYFYRGLPLAVRNAVQSKLAGHEFISSCEADLIPGDLSQFAAGFFRKGKAELYIFEMEHQYKIKDMLRISDSFHMEKRSPGDFVKTWCLQASLLLNDKRFQAIAGQESFIDELRRSNRELIRISSPQQSSDPIIAYHPTEGKFLQIGSFKGTL